MYIFEFESNDVSVTIEVVIIRRPESQRFEPIDPDSNTCYKFHKYDIYLYQLLILRKFYAPNFEELNDPYDCRFQISEMFIRAAYKERKNIGLLEDVFVTYMALKTYQVFGKFGFELIDNVGITDEKLDVNQLIEIINANGLVAREFTYDILKALDIRIISFTKAEHNDDLTMWAHYANSFYGVKLKFSFDEKELLLKRGVKAVKYKNKWDPLKRIRDVEKAIFKKLIGWKQEKEYRVDTNSKKFVGWESSSLREITFGYKMNYNEIQSIVDLCTALNYKCEYYVLKIGHNGLVKIKYSRKSILGYK